MKSSRHKIEINIHLNPKEINILIPSITVISYSKHQRSLVNSSPSLNY